MSVTKESFQLIDSDYTKNFRDGLANAGASSFANLSIPNVAGGQFKGFVETIRILSLQNLDWRVEFYSKGNTGGYGLAPYFTSPSFISGGQYPTATNPNNSNIIASVLFYSSSTFQQLTPALLVPAGEASRIATAYATLFLYSATGLRIPIIDDDSNTNISGATTPGGLMHVNLVNTNGGKTAGDAGLVHIRFGVVVAA